MNTLIWIASEHINILVQVFLLFQGGTEEVLLYSRNKESKIRREVESVSVIYLFALSSLFFLHI